MKIKSNFLSKVSLACLYILLAIVISGCSQSFDFQKSAIVPAAEAKVKVDQMSDGNYSLEIMASNLAKPEDLTPAASVYVVWLKTEANGTVNLGILDLTDNLKGSLKTVSPYSPEQLFISAEPDGQLRVPSTQIVLVTDPLKVK